MLHKIWIIKRHEKKMETYSYHSGTIDINILVYTHIYLIKFTLNVKNIILLTLLHY